MLQALISLILPSYCVFCRLSAFGNSELRFLTIIVFFITSIMERWVRLGLNFNYLFSLLCCSFWKRCLCIIVLFVSRVIAVLNFSSGYIYSTLLVVDADNEIMKFVMQLISKHENLLSRFLLFFTIYYLVTLCRA